MRTKASERERKNRENADARAITLPDCANPERRAFALSSLWNFGQTYYANKFYIAPAPIHLELTTTLEKIIREGGNEADVLPRGSAKTTWMEIAVMWAVLAGLRKFVVLVAGTGELAASMLDRIKAEVEGNDLLLEDFPEVCAPVRLLEGIAIRAKSMTLKADPTDIPLLFEWKKGKVTFPNVPNSPALGATIKPIGIEGNLRGLMHKQKGGKTIRPDLVLIDDPQTRESASSPHQVRERINTINGDILGLAGPRRKISAMIAATIIQRGDVADQLTDRKLNPVWQGRRVPMVLSWPTAHETLWLSEYAELRKEAQRGGDAAAKVATDFYNSRREEMDAGGQVYWPERHNADEVSGLQHAYNLLIDFGKHVFFSEYQNDPQPIVGAAWEITPEMVAARVSSVPRGQVPEGCGTLSLGCDVNIKNGLNWVLLAETPEGAGFVVDYGKFPSGEVPLWKEGASYTEEQAIFNGLLSVFDHVCAQQVYLRADNGERVFPAICAADCSYKREAVFRAVQTARMKYGSTQFVAVRGLSSKTYRPLNAARKGDSWHVGEFGPSRALFINVDTWRERMQKGFLLPMGSMGGSLALFGKQPAQHAEIADQLTAEMVIDVLHGERMGMVYVWGVQPGRKNDKADALTYAMAASCYAGVKFGGVETSARKMQKDMRDAKNKVAKIDDVEAMSKPPPIQSRAFMNHRASSRGGGFAKSW